jgi:type IV pilus assembly protein PilZ
MAEELNPQEAQQPQKPSVLSLAIKEKAALYAAYMPFIKGGGLFIPTNKPFKVGEEVFMLLSLINNPEKIKVVGHIVWVSTASQANRPQGVGVQFSEKNGGAEAKKKIEDILGLAIKSSRATHTM